jgi:LPXTG-motif cell wall-anchored protein
MFQLRRALLALATASACFGIGSAQAVTTVVCPNPIPATGTVRVMSITVADTTPASGCLTSSNDNSIPLTLAGYELIDKFGANEATEQVNGALTMVETSAGQGTFSIAGTGDFFNLVLALKDGNNAGPKIEYFSLGAGILSGAWTIEEWVNGVFKKYKGLSTAILFGQECPDEGCPCTGPLCNPPPGTGEVPIPGAFLLMGTVLAGGGGFTAWRRRRERAAS